MFGCNEKLPENPSGSIGSPDEKIIIEEVEQAPYVEEIVRAPSKVFGISVDSVANGATVTESPVVISGKVKLNYGKMAGIARYVVRLVRSLDGKPGDDAPARCVPADGAGLAWGLEEFDTMELELAFLKEALGPLAAGVHDREGIDELALRLRAAMYRSV